MPQLNTSTWFITIMSMIITLFVMFQLKFLSYYYYNKPEYSMTKLQKHTNPWEAKWTKIYLPLLSLQQ
uniref:ATP synthase complex subunit 8 n=1 Tax=Harpiocephalus harpia TaxID=124749 RepID=A0A890JFT0_HARHA|nr:ATP synthase F0 subunit 8 [Harpiocephalus harpia]